MNFARFLAESCRYQGVKRLHCTIAPMKNVDPLCCNRVHYGRGLGPGPAQPSRAPRSAASRRLPRLVTAADCRRLVQYAPSGDVNYRPGADVYGRSVAPADLSPPPSLGPPELMTVIIDADLRRFGVPATSPLFQPFVGVGTISFDSSGNVLFNGQPLGGSEQYAIAQLCRQRMPGGVARALAIAPRQAFTMRRRDSDARCSVTASPPHREFPVSGRIRMRVCLGARAAKVAPASPMA